MSDIKSGGPAFPQDYEHTKVLTAMAECGEISPQALVDLSRQLRGMTLRQYAAIKLRVPNSGTDWLDEMIRVSLRDELAAKAMQAVLPEIVEYPDENWRMGVAIDAYMMADATLTAREAKQ